MPYIYSLGYKTWLTGTPFMRALPLDFPADPQVADLRDEYMFGPAFLVAPVTDQGATRARSICRRAPTGTTTGPTSASTAGKPSPSPRPSTRCPCLSAPAPSFRSDRAVVSTHEPQRIEKVRVYPGADASFTLFSDDGTTYAYENGAGAVTNLVWNDVTGKLTHTGAGAWTAPDALIVEVVQPGSGARRFQIPCPGLARLRTGRAAEAVSANPSPRTAPRFRALTLDRCDNRPRKLESRGVSCHTDWFPR